MGPWLLPALLAAQAPAPAPAIPGSVVQRVPAHPFDQEHLRLEMRLDPAGLRAEARAVLRVRILQEGLRELALDAEDLEVREARVDGRPAPFSVTPGRLVLTLPRIPTRGRRLRLEVRYGLPLDPARPAAGLHMVLEGGPMAFTQAWPRSGARIFPAHHDPDDALTSETLLTVPAGWAVAANGRRLEDRAAGPVHTVHHRLDRPHASYLVAFAAGPMDRVQDRPAGRRRTPLAYWAPAGRGAEARRAFAATPQLLQAYEAYLGLAFPWPKYDQVAVPGLPYGGMENVTCTFQALAALHPPAWDGAAPGLGLVAHELAHSWFGDLVTPRSWGHLWLSEGLTTWLGAWGEGHVGGPDAFDWARWRQLQGYFAEDGQSYRRPLVTDRWMEVQDMGDAHTYEGGALRAELLRRWVGDGAFREGLRSYLQRWAGRGADTADLRRCLWEASGDPLDAAFAAWFHGAGVPELETEEAWDPQAKAWRLELKQVQSGPGVPEAFPFPLDLRLETAEGPVRRRVWVRDRTVRVELPCASAPRYAVLDDGQAVPKRLRRQRPAAEAAAQLEDPSLANRLAALQELQDRLPAPEAAALALARAPRESLPKARAHFLGAALRDPARAAEVMAAADREPDWMRADLLKRAARTAPAAVRSRAQAWLDGDRPLLQEAALEALPALARDGDPEWALGRARAFLGRASWNHRLRIAALGALGELGAPEAGARLAEAAGPDQPTRVRLMAATVLGTRPGDRPEPVLVRLLDDPDLAVREAATASLAKLGAKGAVPALKERLPREPDGRGRRTLKEALGALGDPDHAP